MVFIAFERYGLLTLFLSGTFGVLNEKEILHFINNTPRN